MSARDLIDGEAELDSEEDDGSFDEDAGEVRRKTNGNTATNGTNGRFDDSSEEDEDDDDEEAARIVSLDDLQLWSCFSLTNTLGPGRIHRRRRRRGARRTRASTPGEKKTTAGGKRGGRGGFG